MSKKDIYRLAIRILGVVLFIKFLNYVQVVAYTYYQYKEASMFHEPGEFYKNFVVNFAIMGVFLALSVLFLLKTDVLLPIFLRKKERSEEVEVNFKAENLLGISIIVIGIYILTISAPYFLVNLIQHIKEVQKNHIAGIPDIIYFDAAKILTGILVLVLSKPVSTWYKKKKETDPAKHPFEKPNFKQ